MKISRQKRNQLMAVCCLTVATLMGLYFWLIRSQQQHLENLVNRKDSAARKLQVVQQTIASAGEMDSALATASAKVAELEDTMATGDLYSWAINTIRTFKPNYKIDIPQFSQIDGPRDTTLLPAFPYKQASMTISGNGSFHDFGTFLADFENQFPYMRVLNLNLEPAASASGTDREKLAFRMEIVTLVKPG